MYASHCMACGLWLASKDRGADIIVECDVSHPCSHLAARPYTERPPLPPELKTGFQGFRVYN